MTFLDGYFIAGVYFTVPSIDADGDRISIVEPTRRCDVRGGDIVVSADRLIKQLA